MYTLKKVELTISKHLNVLSNFIHLFRGKKSGECIFYEGNLYMFILMLVCLSVCLSACLLPFSL